MRVSACFVCLFVCLSACLPLSVCLSVFLLCSAVMVCLFCQVCMFVLLVFIRLSLFIALTFILSLNPHSASEDFKALMRELPVEGPLPESALTEVATAWQLIRLPWEVPQDWQSAFPQPPPESVPQARLNMILRSMMQKVFGHFNWVAK